MGENRKNPMSSTLIQGLLELAKNEHTDDDTIKMAKDMYDRLMEISNDGYNPIVKDVDTIVAAKSYADDKISFSQHGKFNNIGNTYKLLTVHEITLLDFFISLMSQHNKIQLHINNMTDNLPMSRRMINDCLKSLINKGYIAVAQNAIRRKSIPAIYMINPDVAICCKKSNINHLAIKFYELSKVKREKFLQKITPQDTIQSIITVDKVKIGTIKQKGDCANTK